MVRFAVLYLFAWRVNVCRFLFHSAWIAVTNNRNYVRLNGLRTLVSNPNHKQEIVAGNLAGFIKVGKCWAADTLDAASYLGTAYHRAYSHVSGKCASYREVMLGAETGGFQHLASTLVPNSIGEVAEVRYLSSRSYHSGGPSY